MAAGTSEKEMKNACIRCSVVVNYNTSRPKVKKLKEDET
jgi:hypothetical protein